MATKPRNYDTVLPQRYMSEQEGHDVGSDASVQPVPACDSRATCRRWSR